MIMIRSAILWVILSALGIYLLTNTTGIFYGIIEGICWFMLFSGLGYLFKLVRAYFILKNMKD